MHTFATSSKLNLHGNNLRELAEDMSQLAVEELDITQNPFTDLIVLVRQLQTLPRLKKLQVSLLSKVASAAYDRNKKR